MKCREKQKTPYERGYTAGFGDDPITANPFSEHGEKYQEWEEGWHDGDMARAHDDEREIEHEIQDGDDFL